VIEAERLAAAEVPLSFSEDVPAPMVVRADAEQLHRVLMNLVRNARQAIAATGKAGEICVHAEEDDTAWWLFVRDTGPGLPPRAKDFLFRPFQGGTRKGGAGLGLVIAAELVRGHGGRLELRKSDAEGTEFAIYLPKSEVLTKELAEE